MANSPPKFVRNLKDARVSLDKDCRLGVKVTGHPAPVITWFKDGVEIVTLHTLPSEVCETYTFVISSAQEDDCGEYSCEATNMYGKAATSSKVVLCEESVAVLLNRKGKRADALARS